MNNQEYWAKREDEALKHYITDEKEYDKQIERIYQTQLDSIQKEIDSFYGKYASKEGISIAEAKKRVSDHDVKAFERKAKKYVEEKNFSKTANEELRLYNATMRINRLEMLKANIGLELIAGGEELEKFMGGILRGRTEDELKRQAGILGKTIKNNAQLAHTIPNASFHNATFSDRIWMNQDLLKSELSKLLQTGMIQGKNPRVLARELKKTFNTSTYNAERLMRTELARVQTEAQKQSFERNGFEQYTFLANSGCCDICQGLNGKHFKVADMMPGENAAPLHPHCRCSTAAYEDSKEYEEWLDYLANGGTTEEWEKIQSIRRASESGKYQGEIKRVGTNAVDMDYIKSEEYRKKFNQLTDNSTINNRLRNYAEAILTHRKGTDYEDIYIINAHTGELILRKTSSDTVLSVDLTMAEIEDLRQNYYGKMISIHNHPTNVPPTGADYVASGYRGYNIGLVVTHSGEVYKYKSGNTSFLAGLFDKRVDKYTQKPYNMSVLEAHEKALDDFEREYGTSWLKI